MNKTTGSHRTPFLNIRYDIFVCLFLVATTLFAYCQVRNHEFITYDDDMYVTENNHVRSGVSLRGIIWSFTTTHAGNWHPLTWLSHMLDFEMFGMNPGWHHLTSLFFHTINAVFLFLLLQRSTGALWRSGFVAALFALHPLHVESVAWVAERKDVLSALFWILTMWFYLLYVEHPGIKRYVLVLLFFVLGLMAKPMLVTLPFVLLLFDYWPLGRFQFKGRRETSIMPQEKSKVFGLLLEKIPLFVFAAASSVVTFFVQQKGGAVSSLEMYPFYVRIENALAAYGIYLAKMLWPFPLAVFYPHPGAIPFWQVAVSFFLLASIFFLVILIGRRFPYLPFGWFWYIGTLVPVIGLVQVGAQARADRYTYIPLVGIFIIIAWGAHELTKRWRFRKTGLSVSAVIILIALITLTWIQTGHWKNSTTLFQHALKVTTDNYLAQNHLGVVLTKQGKFDEAVHRFSRVLQMYPEYIEAHNNLGVALAKQGKIHKAESSFLKALQINPDNEKARYNMGNALARQGRENEAIGFYAQVLKINPENFEAHNNMGNALFNQGKLDEAIDQYMQALKIHPDYPEAHINLGVLLSEKGRISEAIHHYTQALQIAPGYPEVHNNLGFALMRQGKVSQAVFHFKEALRLRPDYAIARNNLKRALEPTPKKNEVQSP